MMKTRMSPLCSLKEMTIDSVRDEDNDSNSYRRIVLPLIMLSVEMCILVQPNRMHNFTLKY